MSEETQTETRPAAAVPFQYDRQLVISVSVSDLEKAIEWYRECLGFEVTYKLAEYGWCEVKTPWGGVTLGLGQSEEAPKTGGTTPTFGVTDIDAARRHLEAHGVRFDGDTHEIEGMVKLATFYDPDGNPFMLAQTLRRDFREQHAS
jgi:catechol 2,3-dioxygenase-like lactoylglutathione lyase family enzyme